MISLFSHSFSKHNTVATLSLLHYLFSSPAALEGDSEFSVLWPLTDIVLNEAATVKGRLRSFSEEDLLNFLRSRSTSSCTSGLEISSSGGHLGLSTLMPSSKALPWILWSDGGGQAILSFFVSAGLSSLSGTAEAFASILAARTPTFAIGASSTPGLCGVSGAFTPWTVFSGDSSHSVLPAHNSLCCLCPKPSS